VPIVTLKTVTHGKNGKMSGKSLSIIKVFHYVFF